MKQPPKINPGDSVPRTGLYRLDAGTQIIPVNKLRKKSRAGNKSRSPASRRK